MLLRAAGQTFGAGTPQVLENDWPDLVLVLSNERIEGYVYKSEPVVPTASSPVQARELEAQFAGPP